MRNPLLLPNNKQTIRHVQPHQKLKQKKKEPDMHRIFAPDQTIENCPQIFKTSSAYFRETNRKVFT